MKAAALLSALISLTAASEGIQGGADFSRGQFGFNDLSPEWLSAQGAKGEAGKAGEGYRREPELCADPPLNDCGFYRDCLEARYQCKGEGYPLAHGEHYCQKFLDARDQMSAAGQRWVTDTMICLQRALVQEAVGPRDSTCGQIMQKAQDSHLACYVESGFCEIGQDWKVIDAIVGRGFVLDLVAFKQTAALISWCSKRWVSGWWRNLRESPRTFNIPGWGAASKNTELPPLRRHRGHG